MSFNNYNSNNNQHNTMNNSCNCNKPCHHHCSNGHKDELYEFHQTLMKGVKEFEESNDHLIQAIKALEVCIYLLEESFEENKEGSKYMQEAFEWLNKYGYNYDCNYNKPHCKDLEYKATQEFIKAQNVEAEALKLVKCALEKLCSAKKDYEDGSCLTDELVKCVHGKC